MSGAKCAVGTLLLLPGLFVLAGFVAKPGLAEALIAGGVLSVYGAAFIFAGVSDRAG